MCLCFNIFFYQNWYVSLGLQESKWKIKFNQNLLKFYLIRIKYKIQLLAMKLRFYTYMSSEKCNK